MSRNFFSNFDDFYFKFSSQLKKVISKNWSDSNKMNKNFQDHFFCWRLNFFQSKRFIKCQFYTVKCSHMLVQFRVIFWIKVLNRIYFINNWIDLIKENGTILENYSHNEKNSSCGWDCDMNTSYVNDFGLLCDKASEL